MDSARFKQINSCSVLSGLYSAPSTSFNLEVRQVLFVQKMNSSLVYMVIYFPDGAEGMHSVGCISLSCLSCIEIVTFFLKILAFTKTAFW